MLRLPRLKRIVPRNIVEAVRVLAEAGAQARLLAGGTDLLPKLKRRQFGAETLISLRGIEGFSGIRPLPGGARSIGAGTTLAAIVRSPELEAFAALRQAAASAATPQIRNAATVGGNVALDTRCTYYDQSDLWRGAQGFCKKTDARAACRAAPKANRCFAAFSADLPPALIALGARVRLIGPSGKRLMALEELYRDDGRSPVGAGPGEIISELLLEDRGLESIYLKLRRKSSFDFPALGVAAALKHRGGTVLECRIVLGAVSSAPVTASEASRMLIGERLTPELIAAAAKAAARAAKPVPNVDFSPAYRRKMVRVYVARALESFFGRDEREWK